MQDVIEFIKIEQYKRYSFPFKEEVKKKEKNQAHK